MLRALSIRLLIVLVTTLAAPAVASMLVEGDPRVMRPGSAMEYLEDPSGALDAVSLRRDPQAVWRRAGNDVLSFGYTASVYWVRFRLPGSDDDVRHMVEVAYPVLDHVDAYVFAGDQLVSHYRMGDRLPYRERPIDHPNFIFPVEVSEPEGREIYLRVESTSSVQIPVVVYRDGALAEYKYNEGVIQALFYGAMIMMALYNFLLFVSTRDVSFFYYVLYVVFITLLLAGIEGLPYKYLWPEAVRFNEASLVLALAGMAFFPVLFFRSFLALPKTRPITSRILMGFAVAAVFFAIGAFLLPYRIMIVSSMALVICAIMVGFWAGIVRWLDGYYAARYFNVAWIFMLSGGFLLAMNKLGFLPRNWFTEHVGQIGASLEVMLLSFALAGRINYERRMRELAQRESAEAQAHLLQHQIRANEDLDRLVRARTDELERANARLRQMSATDGLTGLYNRRAFEESFANEYKRAYREGTPLTIMMIDLDHFKQVNDSHGHPFGDLCLVRAAEIVRQNLRRPPDVAARYGGEEFIVLLPNTDMAGGATVAENILADLAAEPVVDGNVYHRLTASIGLACCIPGEGMDREALLREADEQLYVAKEEGRNRIRYRAA